MHRRAWLDADGQGYRLVLLAGIARCVVSARRSVARVRRIDIRLAAVAREVIESSPTSSSAQEWLYALAHIREARKCLARAVAPKPAVTP